MQSPLKDRAMSASPLKPKDAKVEPVDMKLEVVVIGVSDVDVAKAFYEKLGWRVDADFAKDDFRVVQLTPHNSRMLDHLRQGSNLAETRRGQEPDSRGG